MQHVIIGAGPAGVIAAETLRKRDPASAVTLIGDEPGEPYSRMALPYYLSGRIDAGGTHLRKSEDHYSRLGVERINGRVTGVSPAQQQVVLSDGKLLDYDRLLIATGSRPATPPIAGIDSPGIFPCWTLADARQIAARMKPGARVVLMGAGFIGCIILEALAASGAELTVVEMEARMVPRMMNDKAGGLIKKWCEEKGGVVKTCARVSGIEKAEQNGGLVVMLEDGEVLAADLVVTATGVRANIEFLADSGIETDRGVLVDRQLQTLAPGVYAAGDVAQGLDFSTGEYVVQAIQPTAAVHGQLAAHNMAGAGLPYQGTINMNVLDTLGLISSSFGLWMGVDCGESTECCDAGRYRYINLQFEDDVLVGATCLGLTQHIGVLRGLIQSRVRLGKWKNRLMQDPTRIMEAYLGSTLAIGHNAAVF